MDTNSHAITDRIYKLIFNETYFYKDFPQRSDHDVAPLSPNLMIKFIEFLMRFEASATHHPLNEKLIFYLFFSAFAQRTQKVGVQFLKHMIRFNDLQRESEVSFLKQTILKIRSEQQFSDDVKAMSYVLVGDMAEKNYKILDDDIDIAIDAFQHLRTIVQDLENQGKEIRSDDTALCYIEALNKLRDCYEKNLKDANKRSLLIGYVLNYLNKEGKCNQEIVYLLFLYLSRLEQGSANSSSVLLYSIILKDHPDIKIKKEA